MRQAAVAQMGFYAAPPEAVAMVAAWLHAPKRFAVLDPCAGEGLAVDQLVNELQTEQASIYAVELDEGRAVALRDNLPGCNVAAPASCFGMQISAQSFGLAWVNAPFGDDLMFLNRATHLLAPKGIMALVCPEKTSHLQEIRQHFQAWYERVIVLKFPDAVRKHNEVVMLGRKLKKEMSPWSAGREWINIARAVNRAPQPEERYAIPATEGPARFEKIELTPAELIAALKASPLLRSLEVSDKPIILSPPMSLGKGHRAILLAAGHLDGLVRPEGEPPHVVRGTAQKVPYIAEETEDYGDDGSLVRKTIIAEKIQLVVRAVDSSGKIVTLGDEKPTDARLTPEKKVEAIA